MVNAVVALFQLGFINSFQSECELTLTLHNPPYIDANGVQYQADQAQNTWCPTQTASRGDGISQCLQQHGIVGAVYKYQPASRLGTFHVIENCLNLALMILALAVAWWCVRNARTTA